MALLPVTGGSTDPKVAAVSGTTTGIGSGTGVWGFCAHGHGVEGGSTTSKGVVGRSEGFHGVFGHSTENVGVAGESDKMWGVLGVSKGAVGIGVHGKNADVVDGGYGVVGVGKIVGVLGESVDSSTGIGVHGKGGRRAGFFEGDVEVTGDFHQQTGHIRLGTGDIHLGNGDCAEDFDISGADKVDPGTVMVLGKDGALFESQQAFDKRVAGVISGAGDYRPGIVLDKRPSPGNRQPVALMGKVFCKVDAQFGQVEVGDLLTTSPTPGHAMKTNDPYKAFGAVIGKALRPLSEGQSLIPILIALQ